MGRESNEGRKDNRSPIAESVAGPDLPPGLRQSPAVGGQFVDEEEKTEEIGFVEQIEDSDGIQGDMGRGERRDDIQADGDGFDVQGPGEENIGHHRQEALGAVKHELHAENRQSNIFKV